jgi:hypothetical protein
MQTLYQNRMLNGMCDSVVPPGFTIPDIASEVVLAEDA